jgi:hypothetical protein
MSTNRSWKQPQLRDSLAIHRLRGRTLVALTLLAALAAAGSQAGCDKNPSPTYTPPPQLVVTSASYTLLIAPTHWTPREGPEYPQAGELLVDSQSLWAGSLPRNPHSYAYDYFYHRPASIVVESPGTLDAGTHTLRFRVTDQLRSPTEYLLSGWVDLIWSYGNYSRVQRAARWQDVAVRLTTGQEWSADFAVAAP